MSLLSPKKIAGFSLVLVVASWVLLNFAPAKALAANPLSFTAVACRSLPGANAILGINSWNKYLDCDATNETIINFSFPEDIWLVVIALLEIVMRLAVYLSIGVVTYGGFKFMLAQGSPDKIQEAKSIIEQALIGLAISSLSILIVNFIGGAAT